MSSIEHFFDATGPVFNFDMSNPVEQKAYHDMCHRKWAMVFGYPEDVSVDDMATHALASFAKQYGLNGNTSWEAITEAHREGMALSFELEADASWDQIASANRKLEAMSRGLPDDALWDDIYAARDADPILCDQDLGTWHSWESAFTIARMLLDYGRLTAVGVVSQDERQCGSWVATHLEEMGDPQQTLENLRQISPMLYEGMTQFELQLTHAHPYSHPMATSPDGLILAIIYSN